MFLAPLLLAFTVSGSDSPTPSPEEMSATVQLDLTDEVVRMIGETEKNLSIREALASGLQISVDGRSPIQVTLDAIPIRGRLLPDCSGEAFRANPGVSAFPGDQFEAGAEQIAETGTVFGQARVDWRQQWVLYLAVVPTDSRVAADSRTRPIAFVVTRAR